MRDIRNSLALKALCFITIPIMIFIIIINIVIWIMIDKNPDLVDSKNVYETAEFGNLYNDKLIELKHRIIAKDNYEYSDRNNNYEYSDVYVDPYVYYDLYTNDKGEKIYYEEYRYINFDYIVIDKKANEVYTNMDITVTRNSVAELKADIVNTEVPYWNFVEGNIDSNISKLTPKNLKYTDDVYQWMQDGDVEIYTTLNKYTDGFWEIQFIYDAAKTANGIPIILISVILVILTIAACIYLLVSLGHKKGYDGIYLDALDRIPLEIVISVFVLFMCLGFAMLNGVYYGPTLFELFIITLTCVLVYICLAFIISTIIKRIKSHTFIKNTLIYRLFKWIKNTGVSMFENKKLTTKLIILYGGFLLVLFILSLMFLNDRNFFIFLLICGFLVYIFAKLLNYFKNLYKIKDAIKNIYEGKNDTKLEPEKLKGELNEVAIHVNDIAGGFSNAIEENIKNERLKTELITNVSHDIKTPLTSIINYVDLLEQEKIENEKANEYIQILDQKSQRLKKLTEDLVEASKASSGNVKLEIERLNIVELIKQATAEFEDKFNAKSLKIVSEMPESDVYIKADSRYMYRVIENVFSNIAKYALEESRVYIDVFIQNEKAIITIKNISKAPLNISAEELMQRFVRGDKSRTTEGSGLGLSISKSLTELQHGNFNLQIDGDLFKVEIVFGIED